MDLPPNLKETTFAELIQIVEISGRSGRLQIHMTDTNEHASVYFSKGSIIHATTNRYQGVEALWELFSWVKGQIFFNDGVTMPPQTIKESNSELIKKGLKKATKTYEILLTLPPMDTVLKVNTTGLGGPDEMQLDSEAWNFLILVDGKRTLREIFDEYQQSSSKTAALISTLLEQKVIVPVK
ncbi:MAG TPA: DUF4388 domain-containing protein [Caldisericia bacterium]|nr:DUF4388 domain-containing protein [Caldisericia bacterium]HPF48227.1 DUF4388 domain-containing protein [Caldisericia bacterium]HPI83837.1 DUF4388 domain-containing protein [Caldisericia bacterium]HPQ92680.1 DUF4388 domain-containing protein [Caldisericia bacterium]HRV74222.1 DUF4388 domain-containing protein [Caldisericia bacterium]